MSMVCRRSAGHALCALAVVLMFCVAALAQDVLYQESFDGKTMASGWSQQTPAGTGNSYRTETTQNPVGILPYSKPQLMLMTTSDGGKVRGFPGTSFNTNGYSSLHVRFMMYHDTASAANDRLRVQVSTTNAVTWNNVGDVIDRYTGSDGWQPHDVDISDWVDQSSLYFALMAEGSGGSDIHIDNLQLLGTVSTPDVEPSQATTGSQLTITGSHFGTTPGKVNLIPNTPEVKPVALKVVSWSDGEIVGLIAKDSVQGTHNLQILRKEPKGASAISAPSVVDMRAPQITSLSDNPVAPGQTVTVYGNFFGAKRPTVLLAFTGTTPDIKCKVTGYTMNPENGASNAAFIVPATLPVGSVFDIYVINKVGATESVGGLTTSE